VYICICVYICIFIWQVFLPESEWEYETDALFWGSKTARTRNRAPERQKKGAERGGSKQASVWRKVWPALRRAAYDKRDLNRWQTTPSYTTKEKDINNKRDHIYDKRDLHVGQKRPTYMTEKSYIDEQATDKRDLHMWQKRPAYVTKETCIYDTRVTCQHWPVLHWAVGAGRVCARARALHVCPCGC